MILMIIFWFYRNVVLNFLVFLLQIAKPFHSRKIQEFFLDRKKSNLQSLPKNAVWVHASSGEIEYAKELIRLFKKDHKVVISYFSPSAKKLIENIECDGSFALPIDSISNVKNLLEQLQPKTLVISKTDLWPELIYQCKQNKVPTVLIAASFNRNWFNWGRLSLKAFCLNQLSKIFCVREEDLNFVKTRFPKIPSALVGDPRMDQIEFRISHPKKIKDFLRPKTPTIVLGSTWTQDENEVFDLDFYSEVGLSVIIAPHELSADHIEQIQVNARYYGYSTLMYSSAEISDHDWSNKKQVLIIDQVGILPEIYQWGSIAFVGGSFKSKVHNIMEPLSCGLPVIVGPYSQNSFEVQKFRNLKLGDVPLVQIVEDFEDFKEAIYKIPRQIDTERLNQLLASHKGASQKIYTQLNGNFL